MFLNDFSLLGRVRSLHAIALVVVLTAPAAAQDNAQETRARAERATTRLAALAARDSGSGEIAAAASARRHLLASLIERDPAAALRLALPASVRDALPADVRSVVEEEVDLEGEMEVLVEDYEHGARERHFLSAGGRRYEVHVAGPRPDLVSGDRVRVRGIALGGSVAADGGRGAGSIVTVSAALPYSFGEQRALWILVTFQDKTAQPYSAAAARDMLFGTVDAFYRENSQDQTWISGDVVGWFPIAMSSSVCDPGTLRTLANQAARNAGVDLATYRRFIYGFPANACAWWGLGQVGGSSTYALVNGGMATRVVGHELGHNLGLNHAHALECGSQTIGSSCSIVEYGDPADILGVGGVVAHFNAYHKERLGWLNYGSSDSIVTVQGSGSFFIDPYTPSSTAPKALKILKEVNPSNGKPTWYFLEHRRGAGFDSGLAKNANLLNGVVVHLGNESQGRSYVLDMTPETSSWNDPALTVGRTFSDPVAGVHITTLATGTAGASVMVDLGSVSCVPAPPTVSATPTATQWAAAGTPVSWTVSVRNNDNAGCAGSSIAVGATAPAGWTAAVASPSLALAPGQTGTTTLRVTSPAGAADGFYNAGATAAAEGGSGSADVTYAVLSAFGVDVASNAASYAARDTVFLTATVTSGEAGVPVGFTVTKADGKKVSGTTTTDASGRAVFSLKLQGKLPAGMWTARAVASLGGISAFGTTTFQVR